MADYYFTLEEAQELVSWLKEIFQDLIPLSHRLSELDGEIRVQYGRMGSNGGGAVDGQLLIIKDKVDETSSLIEKHIQPIIDRGILIQSIGQGLVDFPSIREGREVYLCWKVEELDIQFWHEVDSGFAGRQPL